VTTSPTIAKFDRLGPTYREHDYADPDEYFRRKAELVFGLAPHLDPGADVLDLGCGDGSLAQALATYAVRYVGVDISQGMIDAARVREPHAEFVCAAMEAFEPTHPVDATICLRSFSYPKDRGAFFRRVRSYTRLKFVFDFDPRVHSLAELRDDLAHAGFEDVAVRRLLLPQRRRIAAPVRRILFSLERTPVSAALVRTGFPARTLVTAR
jgi:SAM-dependent methyltransferase